MRGRTGAPARHGRPRTTLGQGRRRSSDGPPPPRVRRRYRAFCLVRPSQSPLTPALTTDLHDVIRAALDGVSASRVIARAWQLPEARERLVQGPLHIVAAGKAAPAMATALMVLPE